MGKRHGEALSHAPVRKESQILVRSFALLYES